MLGICIEIKMLYMSEIYYVMKSLDTSHNLNNKEDATSDDFCISKSRGSTRSVMPPKRLKSYFWAERK